MSFQMLKVGVIGAGRMGQVRAQAARGLGANVVVVCDSDESRANALADQVGAQAAVDENSVRLDKLDALFVCTPPSSRDIGVRAIGAGVPLMVEKPLGLSIAACQPLMHALAQRSGLTAVGYMNRYRPGVKKLKDLLRKERPLGLAANWLCGRYNVPWWRDPGQSGGPVNEQCSHLVDLCRYLVGEIASVQAIVSLTTEPPESAAVIFRFANGALGTLLYSCEAEEKLIGLRVFTTRQIQILDGWDFRSVDEPHSDQDKNAIFYLETQHFFDAIANDRPSSILADIPDAFRTQKVVDAIFRSAEKGTIVDVE